MLIHTAMILAAGRGERLLPLTARLPKPLVQIGDYTLVEHHLRAVKTAGIHRVVINVSHLGHMIESALGDGQDYGLEIVYSREGDEPLETAGGIVHALPYLQQESFLVINGDVLCDFPYEQLSLSSDMNMHLVFVTNPSHNPDGDFSVMQGDQSLVVTPNSDVEQSYTFSGIGLYRRRVFENLTPGKRPLVGVINNNVDQKMVSATVHQGMWVDVGTPERLKQAQKICWD